MAVPDRGTKSDSADNLSKGVELTQLAWRHLTDSQFLYPIKAQSLFLTITRLSQRVHRDSAFKLGYSLRMSERDLLIVTHMSE